MYEVDFEEEVRSVSCGFVVPEKDYRLSVTGGDWEEMVSNTVDISSTDPWASYIGYYTVQDQSFGRLEEAVEAVSRLKEASIREEPTKTNSSETPSITCCTPAPLTAVTSSSANPKIQTTGPFASTGLSEHAKAYLKRWLNEHKAHPYPSREKKDEMCRLLRISEPFQLDGWLCRERKKLRQPVSTSQEPKNTAKGPASNRSSSITANSPPVATTKIAQQDRAHRQSPDKPVHAAPKDYVSPQSADNTPPSPPAGQHGLRGIKAHRPNGCVHPSAEGAPLNVTQLSNASAAASSSPAVTNNSNATSVLAEGLGQSTKTLAEKTAADTDSDSTERTAGQTIKARPKYDSSKSNIAKKEGNEGESSSPSVSSVAQSLVANDADCCNAAAEPNQIASVSMSIRDVLVATTAEKVAQKENATRDRQPRHSLEPTKEVSATSSANNTGKGERVAFTKGAEILLTKVFRDIATGSTGTDIIDLTGTDTDSPAIDNKPPTKQRQRRRSTRLAQAVEEPVRPTEKSSIGAGSKGTPSDTPLIKKKQTLSTAAPIGDLTQELSGLKGPNYHIRKDRYESRLFGKGLSCDYLGTYRLASDAALAHDLAVKRILPESGREETNFKSSQDHIRLREREQASKNCRVDIDITLQKIRKKLDDFEIRLGRTADPTVSRISISKGAESLFTKSLLNLASRLIDKDAHAGLADNNQTEGVRPGRLALPQPATESRSGNRLVRAPRPLPGEEDETTITMSSSGFLSHALFSGKLSKQHESFESAEMECETAHRPCSPNGVQLNLAANLSPAPIPDNPVATTDASHFVKELAWLSAETSLMLASPNDNTLPLALPFAWAHGSLPMRKRIATLFPHQTHRVAIYGEQIDSNREMVVIDGRKLLLDDDSTESINQLRAEAVAAMRLGFFRKESVQKTIERSVSSRQGGSVKSPKPRQRSPRRNGKTVVSALRALSPNSPPTKKKRGNSSRLLPAKKKQRA